MEKYIDDLWTNLQALDKQAQIEMLTEFAEEMYNLGRSDTDEEDDDDEPLEANDLFDCDD